MTEQRARLDLHGEAVNIAFNDSRGRASPGRGEVESDARFYRRRASEELAAASRAVTAAARDRRMQLAQLFLSRLEGMDEAMMFDWSGSGGKRAGQRRGKSVPLCDSTVTSD